MTHRIPILIAVVAVLLPGAVLAAEKDVRAIHLPDEGQKLIDTRCHSCHGQQPIDHALSEKKDMEAIMTRMEKKGVTLSDSDRQVMRVNWQQQLFKEKGSQGQPR